MSDSDIQIDGEPDPKPFKLWRLDVDGQPLTRLGEYATEDEARVARDSTHLDYRTSIYHHNHKLQDRGRDGRTGG